MRARGWFCDSSVMLERLEALIASYSGAILYLSQRETDVKNDSSDIAGQLRYIHYVRESCVAGLLSEMRSSLWLLDFHDLEE